MARIDNGEPFRENEVDNPFFDTAGTTYTAFNATVTLGSKEVAGKTGPTVAKVVATKADPRLGTFSSAASRKTVAVGETWTVSAYFQPAAVPRNASVRINWWNAAGEVISSTEGAKVKTTVGEWARAHVTGTAPENAVSLSWQWVCAAVEGESEEVHYCCDPMIEQAAEPGTFFPTPTQLTSGQAVFTGTEHASSSELTPFRRAGFGSHGSSIVNPI